jgi:nitrite reductase/ring-hydroxylating ferredoxin subunit
MQEEIGRRTMLAGAGCAALTLLGGCSLFPTERKPPPPAPTPTPGQVLAKTNEVPVGGGILTGASVLVLQLRVGEFTAFNATCPHQFFLVRPPDATGIMTCTGHQSKFRATDGVRVDGPATHNLTAIPVQVLGSDVVVA